MSKSIAVLLLSDNNLQALRYVEATLELGHRIERLFFYHDAVHLASKLRCTPQDEFNLNELWHSLIEKHQLPATACIASALKRGILNEQEAQRYNKTQHNLHPSIELAGLGTWLEAVKNSDQQISFA